MDFCLLEERIGYVFKNKDLLRQALTHRSYVNESAGRGFGHNERLEFLGDTVLELIVSDYLFRNFPDKPEGELTSMRGVIVSGEIAAKISTSLGLNEFLLLSRGEARNKDARAQKSILANAFEALIGAIYLDQGYAAACQFVDELLLSKLEGNIREFKSAKCLLQEKAQSGLGITPTYRLLEESGQDHDKQFVMGAYFGERLIAQGVGKSKKEAELEAAKKALKSL